MRRSEALRQARLYLVTTAQPADWLRAAIRGGVDMIQLRDRSLTTDDAIREAAQPFAETAEEHGIPFVLNDRPDLVPSTGAHGVHVGQDDTSPEDARQMIGPDRILGLSTHAPHQGLEAAAHPEVDYLSIGPVHETPTKPGRPAAGLDYVRWAAQDAKVLKPWFAIGGLDAGNVADVVALGARRIVVVRAITEADDPERAARELRTALN
jgi:thiamine-phosphate pyrophosphorylase